IVGERTGNADNNGRCSNLNYFENVGSVGNAVFGADPTIAPNTQCFGRVLFDIQIGLPQYSAPIVVPSGDHLILLTGSDPGRMELFTDLQNGKSGSITLLDDAYGNLDVGNRSAPALADLDHDGYYDMVIGNQRGGLELFHTDLQVGTTAVESPVATTGRPYSIFMLNPAGEYELTWKNGSAGDVEIYDLQGRLVFQSKTADSFLQIDLTGQAAGMYILQLRQGKYHWVEKLVRL
ncbi:MAG TPA: T9SS type A sorting domain-containing protein, partial [Saprospiraceae bacterium]|nr:T9SS type A sorting domain-containing protein [Saprospiraceae bacterium]